MSICSTVNNELQRIHIGDLHPLTGKSGLGPIVRQLYSICSQQLNCVSVCLIIIGRLE